MSKENIPGDVALLIQAATQMAIQNKLEELKKEEGGRLQQEKFHKQMAARIKNDTKRCLEGAKENLSFLNKLIKEEPLKSYLGTTDGFPLWEETYSGSHSEFYIMLREDGVYTWKDIFNRTRENLGKITDSRLAKDAKYAFTNSPHSQEPYIWSLARWDKETIIEYLRRQFTPLS